MPLSRPDDEAHPILATNALGIELDKKCILKGININVYAGDFVSVIGPNGAGKSTLLKMLARQLSPSNGNVHLMGKLLDQWPRKSLAREIAYVPQTIAADISFSAHDFVSMARYPHLSPFSALTQHDEDEITGALTLTNSISYADQPMNRLSGGQRQSVMIAAALAQQAKLLILDEPVTFLDPTHSDDVCELLWKLNHQYEITILMVTHDINHALLLSNKVLALKEGEQVAFASPEQIIQNQVLTQVFNKSFTFVNHPVTGRKVIVPDFYGQAE